jgi:hypothetical protein
MALRRQELAMQKWRSNISGKVRPSIFPIASLELGEAFTSQH